MSGALHRIQPVQIGVDVQTDAISPRSKQPTTPSRHANSRNSLFQHTISRSGLEERNQNEGSPCESARDTSSLAGPGRTPGPYARHRPGMPETDDQANEQS